MKKLILKYGVSGIFGVFFTVMYFLELNEFTELIDVLMVSIIVFGYDLMWLIMLILAIRRNFK